MATAARRQHVYGARAVGHGDGTERAAVQRAADGEHEYGAGGYVAGEAHEEGREARHEHFLARETVHHVAAERAHDECRHGVAAQHYAYNVLSRAERLAEVQRQQRREQVEGEVEQEVGGHDLHVLLVPKYFLVGLCRHCSIALFRTAKLQPFCVVGKQYGAKCATLCLRMCLIVYCSRLAWAL